ncbi:hypothetical protein ADK41_12615 [Streptomyces caelestis]|uniref:Uncharacterized protein n=1 Tax=Streptomyces caelestis TaxID=36816 RepID=A0A0M8QRD3_9ACTN|nr:hypothetical protein ADK41_12615 [Streptomyces caelestis]
MEVFGNRTATLSPPGLSPSGVALALIFCPGLAALAGGLRRWHHERRVRVTEPVAATGEDRESGGTQPVHGHRRLFGH